MRMQATGTGLSDRASRIDGLGTKKESSMGMTLPTGEREFAPVEVTFARDNPSHPGVFPARMENCCNPEALREAYRQSPFQGVGVIV